MPQLPDDVYHHIAKFLPNHIQRGLLSVPGFFHIAMNAHYRETTVGLDTSVREIAKNLRRLKDPFVAKYVQRLNVHFDIDHEHIALLETKKNPKRSWRPLLGRALLFFPKYRTTHKVDFEEAIHALIDVILGLPNVNALHIHMYQSSIHDRSEPFFAAAWKAFGSNLRVLSLQCDARCFRIPLSLDTAYRLRELRLEFSEKVNTPDGNAMLCNVILPAINRHCPILRCLSISTQEIDDGRWNLDFSDFFLNLDPLPVLERFNLNTSIRNLTSPIELTRFLRDHASSLRHVTLELDFTGMLVLHSEDCFRRLMMALESDEIVFTDLETFEFIPTRLLSYKEIASIIPLFSHRQVNVTLQTLSLAIQCLDPPTLSLLAMNLPGLKTLNLLYYEWYVSHSRGFGYCYQLADIFREQLMEQKELYQAWHLREVMLSISPATGSPPGFHLLQKVILECIPSLTSFNLRGNIDL